MRSEEYYIDLIKYHYEANHVYLKKKYKKSYKEIYEILEKQESDTLELQQIFIDYESSGRLYELNVIFGKRRELFRSFHANLFKVDTSKIVPEQLYSTVRTMLERIRNGGGIK